MVKVPVLKPFKLFHVISFFFNHPFSPADRPLASATKGGFPFAPNIQGGSPVMLRRARRSYFILSHFCYLHRSRAMHGSGESPVRAAHVEKAMFTFELNGYLGNRRCRLKIDSVGRPIGQKPFRVRFQPRVRYTAILSSDAADAICLVPQALGPHRSMDLQRLNSAASGLRFMVSISFFVKLVIR